ncbi:uncharacterized protein BDZ99DRAFT_463692 [Mytilinidion resinicola]|uniref:Uncharacterized protein n=1 Tax=Mytilinidion resinicola TaxID=574789 RepID=A0A6A6YIZ3_9PEZI|nr:uncharacterized protein BDZ99DRAFT_463692 [Mytilinidion resinicola]KAF2808822.1 hypothetical protein BDZ99DRAFT_463692 [Mytilinidion resinicola]
MAPSDSDYDPSTPPPAPAKRTRKRTVKALDALQQLPTTRAVPGRPIQIEGRATALPLPQNDEPNSTQQHPAHYELPPFPTRHVSISSERAPEGASAGIGELAELIASLKETIAQQNNIIGNQNKIIEDIRSNRATFQAEQQHLKDQIVELQETIGSLRAQLDTLSIEPPGQPARAGTTLSRSTSTGSTDKENVRQLVATTEAAKQAIQQGINRVERLAGTTVKGFRVWRGNEGTRVIKFSVDKDKEAAVRQTTADWLEPALPGARLVGPK